MFDTNVPLRQFSSYRIGGPARFFYQAATVAMALEAARKARREAIPLFIMGGGTNLVISDDGFDGLVLKPDLQFIETDGVRVRVGAGVTISDLLNVCVEKGLTGLEWAGGLPGTVGGALRGNAGAFGGEIKDVVSEVVSLDTVGDPPLLWRTREECRFAYRNSVFKQSPQEMIVEATLQLQSGDPAAIRQAIDEKIDYRHRRHPMDYPNVGSIFKNIDWNFLPRRHHQTFQHKVKQDPFPILPTAVVVDHCGLRGVSCGGAVISPKHPNFIVNSLEATARDVRRLVELVKAMVKEKIGVELEEEVQFI